MAGLSPEKSSRKIKAGLNSFLAEDEAENQNSVSSLNGGQTRTRPDVRRQRKQTLRGSQSMMKSSNFIEIKRTPSKPILQIDSPKDEL